MIFIMYVFYYTKRREKANEKINNTSNYIKAKTFNKGKKIVNKSMEETKGNISKIKNHKVIKNNKNHYYLPTRF